MVVKALKAKVAAKPRSTAFKVNLPQAKRVSLAGSFNNWDTGSLLGKKDLKGNWTIKVNLTPGTYEYKFFVDGNWITDPGTVAVTNSFGTQNSVIHVK